MSIFMKIIPNTTCFRAICSNANFKLLQWNRYFHCSSILSKKMYLEHENSYAYSILRNKGYAINLTRKVQSPILREEQFKDIIAQDWSKKHFATLLEEFSTLAVYCSEHSICISNPMFDSVIDQLTDSIRFASDEELESVFYYLNTWPEPTSIRLRNFIEVWVALDDECLRRMKSWSHDKLLSYISLFYMLNVVRVSDFTIRSLNKLASKAKQLTPGQLIQTLFFIGVWRKPPFDMHNLEIHLSEIFSQFSVDDLAIISMGFFKSKTPIRDSNLVLRIVDTVIDNSKNIHEVSLAALLKLIRYSSKKIFDDRIYRLLDTLQNEVPRMSVMCNVHIALLGTTTLNFHSGCLNKIADTVINRMSEARVKDIERLVLSYGIFNFIPQTTESFFNKVIDELRKPERIPEIMQYGQSFAYCVSYLSLLGIYPVDLINRVLSEEFLINIYGKQCYSYGKEILIISCMSEIHCNNGIQNRLNEKSTKILAKKYTDYIPNKEHQKHYNVTERMMLDIMELLIEHRGGPQYVIGDHILPYHQRGDIIICDDKFGNPVGLKDMFPEEGFGVLRRPPNNDYIFTSLVIAGRNALIYGTDTATGPFISKIRDLKALGYNAALVRWTLYSKLETTQEKIAFINNIIENCKKENINT